MDGRVLFGSLVRATETPSGDLEEERTGGPLTAAVLGFFPIDAGPLRIAAVASTFRVHVSARRRVATPHVQAILAGEATPASPVEVFLCPLELGDDLGGDASEAEVLRRYRSDVAQLRRKVRRRLHRIAAAVQRGERGFYAHDAWPETG